MNKCLTALFALILALSGIVFADDKTPVDQKSEEKTAEPVLLEQMPLLRSMLPSAVVVSYYFKLDDKGREPRIYGINVKACLEEQRPFQTFGFMIAPDQVLSGNTMALPANLEKITVSLNDHSVEAELEAFYPAQSAVRLKLKAPLEGSRPLTFKTGAKVAYNFFLARENGLWVGGLRKFSPSALTCNLDNQEEAVAIPHSLLLDAEGNAVTVGYSTDGMRALDDVWAPPARWPSISADSLYGEIAKMEKTVQQNFYPVKIRLRRRQLQPNTREYFEEQRKPAEWTVPGMLLTDGRVMLNISMTGQEIGRIERIAVISEGKPIAAQFEFTFKDFGIIMVKPEAGLPGPGITMVEKDLPRLTRQMLFGVEIRMDGDSLDFRTTPSFIRSFQNGWKNMLLPGMIPPGTGQFVFDMQEKLIAMPVRRRVPRSTGESPVQLVPYAEIVKLLASPGESADRQSVPQPETDRDRLGWLGIEFQRMTLPLAELKEVMTYTDNGNVGLLVTYVYPGSPAAEAGLEVYDIVTRITPLATNSPIYLRGQVYDQSIRQNFPWMELDRVPEQYYERMPVPWQRADNRLNLVLTSIGFGEKYRLNYIHDGKMMEKVLTVASAPTYLENAEKFQDKELGLTVNDLTFEVRHYFRMADDAPGVIITNIKTGSKASVAGLKPYEIIFSVNDVTVNNVGEFKKLIDGKSELSFGVKRLNTTRIVKIQAGSEK